MPPATIDHRTLATLAGAGGPLDIQVIAHPMGWCVQLHHERIDHLLITQRGRHMRLFRSLDTLAIYLKKMGIARYSADATHHMRAPAAAGRAAYKSERNAYDAWFREEIQKALDEADDPNTVWVSHEEVEADWVKQRAELSKRIEDKTHPVLRSSRLDMPSKQPPKR